MGWRLPVIFQLQAKLRRMEASSKMCLPLIRAIQDSVQKCFGGMMEDPELKASAVLLPKLKIAWTEEADVEAACLSELRGTFDVRVESARLQKVKLKIFSVLRRSSGSLFVWLVGLRESFLSVSGSSYLDLQSEESRLRVKRSRASKYKTEPCQSEDEELL
ncbi:hypothetical protein MHYP_G00017010 [Metynnis hypsauchen]